MTQPNRAAVAALAAGCLLCVSASASDFKLAGNTHVVQPLGSTLTMELSGSPLLQSLIAFDLDGGPTLVGGEPIPLGFSPAYNLLYNGVSDANGKFVQTFSVPNELSLLGMDVFLAAGFVDPSDPNGLDVANAVTMRVGPALTPGLQTELAGKQRSGPPFFDWIASIPEGEPLRLALVPALHPTLVGTEVDLYVVLDRSALEWSQNPVLSDLSAAVETVTIGAGSLTENTFVLDPGLLSGDGGDSLGLAYDLVVDANRNGLLDGGDLIDGAEEAGVYLIRDPALPGPHLVNEVIYSGGSFLGQDLFYPSDIAQLSNVPIVIVSHGNGHNYLWYDHIGEHLASYGYVVMSHQNNTVPGVETASTTTLTNTDYLLGNLATIAGGALLGKLDKHNITWIGHSRGGEGAARAYDRIFDGTYVPTNFTGNDIVLISSIAPTDFLGTNSATAHAKNFHLWVGVADNDVNGCVSSDVTQCYHLLSRVTNQSQSIALYGAGHGDFHNGGGSSVASGPCLIGRPNTHTIMRGYLLPLVEYHMRANQAGFDYLWRNYEDLHPQSAPVLNPCVVVNLQYTDGAQTGKRVLDDFQTQTATTVASSGAAITQDLLLWTEVRLDDSNTTFTDSATDVPNGMSYCNSTDTERGGILAFDSVAGGSFLSYELLPASRDWSKFARLDFRLCQTTRHPLTTAELGDVQFSVRLTDELGNAAVMSSSGQLAGIEEPYQRTSCGTGVGWGNEFESVRLGLAGFQSLQPSLHLDRIQRLEFLFGAANGSSAARLGIDDIELTVR